MVLSAQSPIRSEGTEVIPAVETIVMAEGSDEGWSMMADIMVVTERQAAHKRLYLLLSGPHIGMNVFYDDISFAFIPKDCQEQVLNSDFEVGDSRFWQPTNKRSTGFDIVSSGANKAGYSMMIRPLLEQNTGYENGLRQNIDSRCILEGQEYLISAKFRLLDATDLASGVECKPTDLNPAWASHCPTITIRGRSCAGNTKVEYLFWNEIEFFQWDKDNFNSYEKTFTVNAEIASCEVSIVFS